MKRRDFVALCTAAAAFQWPRPLSAANVAAWTPQFRQAPAYADQVRLILPGADEFPEEKEAARVTAEWRQAMLSGTPPRTAAGFAGESPLPVRYQPHGTDAFTAAYASGGDFATGWGLWHRSLGPVRSAACYVMPGDRLRYEIASEAGGKRQYRVGYWQQTWSGGALASFRPLSEDLVTSERPLFADVTAAVFRGEPSHREQLAKGIPYWRSRLDPASGIDMYGNCGVAVADIDNDGWDEIYVCQPGGLPNRLYRQRGDGTLVDITEHAGIGILDDTACALFADFRNSGVQDLVVLLAGVGPQFFRNDGQGRFTAQPQAFRFARPAQGSFTGMAAADYDRDGRLDLYLCSYSLFQSEAQYRYPVPYHDAQNGPPNYLFRNRLTEQAGQFEDVTAAVGLDQNNNRYSFAPAWCDYDGSGWPSLYVANDFGRNNLYRNREGRFDDVAAAAGVEDMGPGMSAAWLDYDGDGRPDLYTANMWSEVGQRVVNSKAFAHGGTLTEAYRRHTKGNSLYQNRGDGTFAETGAAQGVEMGRWAWCSDAADFDADGRPELLVTCGMLTNTSEGPDLNGYFWRHVVARSPATAKPSAAYEQGWNSLNQFIRQDYRWCGPEPNVFYRWRGGRAFDFSGVSGLDYAEDGRCFAVTDIDGDGLPDIVLKSRLGPQVRVLRNECGRGRKTVAVALRGTKSNRDGIGAKVQVDGSTQWLQAGSGYLAQHSKRLIFGLGDAEQAKQVRITWPSGLVQEFGPWRAGFQYTVEEGQAEVQQRAFRRRPALAAHEPIPGVDNRQGLSSTWLVEPVPLPDTRSGPGLLALVAGDVNLPAGVPVVRVDLAKSAAETGAAYALFRRYLFDYRAALELPFCLLLDRQGRAAKVYAAVPAAAEVQRDLTLLATGAAHKQALPFAGGTFAPLARDTFKLGAAFLQSGYPEQALPYLRAALEREPDNERCLLGMAQIHARAGRSSEAQAALERLLVLNPRSAAAYNELGGLALDRGEHRRAAELYEQALRLQPDLTAAVTNAAQAYAKSGNAPAAEKLYRQAWAADAQQSPEVANGLGLLLAQQGQGAEALQWFQRAIALRRDYASAINNIGVLYLQLGKPEEALSAFRYGIEAAPDEDLLYLNLGRVYARQGRREQAKEAIQRLLDRKPNHEVAQRALRELETP